MNLPLTPAPGSKLILATAAGESEELARLRQENAQLKKDNKELDMERDVLKRVDTRQVWDGPLPRRRAPPHARHR